MRALVLLGLLVLAPSAVACTIGPVAPPGAFTIRWEDGRERVVPVEGRLLGAGCDLSNRHDLDGDLFAWVEVERYASGYPWNVHVLNVTSDEQTTFHDVARANIEALGLYDRTVLAYWRDWTIMNGTRTLVAIDIDTRERRAIDLPLGDSVSVSIDGSVVFALLRNATGDERLLVYDDATRAIVAEMDTPEPTWLRAAGEAWIVIDGSRGEGPPALEALRIADGFVTRLGENDWVLDVDGDHAYLQTGAGIERVHLPDGAREPYSANDWSLLSLHDGVRVHGRYSAPELNPLGAMWWIVEPTPWTFLAYAGVAIVCVAGLGVVWWRRRSM